MVVLKTLYFNNPIRNIKLNKKDKFLFKKVIFSLLLALKNQSKMLNCPFFAFENVKDTFYMF